MSDGTVATCVLVVLALMASPALGAADVGALTEAMQQPGRHHLDIDVGAADQRSSVPVSVLVGDREGPTLLVLAGVHGSEYAPIVAGQRLANTLDPAELAGRVLIVHVANMPAFLGRAIYVNPADGKNLNRVFPGDPHGSLSERIAALLTDQLYPLADAVLDMHSGDGNEDLNPRWVGFYERAGEPSVIARSRAMAHAFGFRHIVAFQWELVDRSKAIWAGSAAIALGIPAIDVEAGGKNIVDEEAVAAIEEGVRRTLSHLKMSTAVFPAVENQVVIRQRSWIAAPEAGTWIALKAAGQQVAKGELLGYLTDWHGRRRFEARAPAAGLLLLILTAPPVRQGETLAIVAQID